MQSATPQTEGDAGPPSAPSLIVYERARPDQGEVATERAIWGNRLIVRGTGLPASSRVTISAQAHSLFGSADDLSAASFLTDKSGTIDTERDEAIEGTYTGKDVDGLFWSMKPTPTTDATISTYGVRFTLTVDGQEPLVKNIERYLFDQNLLRVDVKDDGLVGAFYAPKNLTSKKPTIVAFGGSEGGVLAGEGLAVYFAARGYPALGLAYFGAPGLPSTLTRVPLEYFDKAYAWLDSRPESDANHIALIGGSRGGELALLLGARSARVTAVVAQVPSGYVWGAATTDGAAWTVNGVDVPSIPTWFSSPKTIVQPDGTRTKAYRETFTASIAHADAGSLAAATISVEKIGGPVLLLGGAADQLWPSCDLADVAMKRLESSGHTKTHADKSLCIPEAGHGLAWFPGTSTYSAQASESGSTALALGGTQAGNGRARRVVDDAISAFLGAALGR